MILTIAAKQSVQGRGVHKILDLADKGKQSLVLLFPNRICRNCTLQRYPLLVPYNLLKFINGSLTTAWLNPPKSSCSQSYFTFSQPGNPSAKELPTSKIQ